MVRGDRGGEFTRRLSRQSYWALTACLLAVACTAPGPAYPAPAHPPQDSLAGPDTRLPAAPRVPAGELVACGRRFAIDAPVVSWIDPDGYSAYPVSARFPAEVPAGTEVPSGLRYRPGRETPAGSVTRRSSVEQLGQVVDQFVLHYDVCGLSRTCFKVLHDRRELSVHFLLDLDGTLYQTLDLADTAWHARQANSRSVGIEIANMGAYPPGAAGPLDEWYVRDPEGTRIRIPERFGDGGLRTPGFTGRPARAERISGRINGRSLEMHDLTPEQYASLEVLTAALCDLLPRIRVEVPRDPGGAVRSRVFTDQELAEFSGILGHFHVSENKSDPGPAFDWERLLAGVRERRASVPHP